MLRIIEQKILQIRKAVGIEIILLPGDQFLINATVVLLKKNKIIKEHAYIGIRSMEELKEKTGTSIPASLIINGKGILTKQFQVGKTDQSLQSVLPNANPNDFYFEKFSNNAVSIISIIRKESFDRIIDELKSAGFRIIAASIGINVLNDIAPFLQQGEETQLETDVFSIKVNTEGKIIGFSNKEEQSMGQYQPDEIRIADQYIKPSNLLSFAAASRLLIDDLKAEPALLSTTIVTERTEYRYSKLFKMAGLGLLILFFLILFINFFIYNNLLHKNQVLQSSRFQDVEEQKKNKKLEKEVSRKEKFLEKSGWKSAGKTSYYADQIASITPPDILLTTLNIYPSKLTDNDDRLFKKDTILINGDCSDPVELNKFISNLKMMTNFKTVNLKNYQYSREKESGAFIIETISKE